MPEGRMRCSAIARLYRQMLHFASLTEILSLRYRLSVFLSPQKEKLRKRKTAQGVPPRSEIHYVTAGSGGDIMNSMRLRPRAPPGTGKPGAVANRDNVHSGERFGIRGTRRLFGKPRGTIPTLPSPTRGRCRRSRRMRCRFRLRNRLQTKM